MVVLWLSLALAVDADADGYTVETDCDDTNPAINPGADEVCELGQQVDNDCDGNPNTHQGAYYRQPGDLPSGVNTNMALYTDADNDEHGDENDTQPIYVCRLTQAEDFFSVIRDDCDDADPAKNPFAGERCNDVDDNCNELIDEPTPNVPAGAQTLYVDFDQDDYGSEESGSLAFCPHFVTERQIRVEDGVYYESDESIEYEGVYYSERGGDCNDANRRMHPREPGFLESIDGLDEDCDGAVLVHELDCDGDGAFAPGPVALVEPGVVGSVMCARHELTVYASDSLQPVVDWRVGLLFEEGERLLDGDCIGGIDCEDSDPGRHSCREDVCDGYDTDCSGADAAEDADADGIPDAMQGGVPGLTTEQRLDTNGDGLDDACDAFGPEVAVLGSGEALPPPPEAADPLPESDDDGADAAASCACTATSAPSVGWWLAVPVLLQLRRRRR